MIVKTVLLFVVLTLDVATGGRVPTAARYHTATTKTPPIRGGKPRNRNDLVPIHRKLLPMRKQITLLVLSPCILLILNVVFAFFNINLRLPLILTYDL